MKHIIMYLHIYKGVPTIVLRALEWNVCKVFALLLIVGPHRCIP